MMRQKGVFMGEPRGISRRSKMKVFVRVGAAIICFVGGGLFAGASNDIRNVSNNSNSETQTSGTGTTVNVYQDEEEDNAIPGLGVAPFLPWAGAGMYYGTWYGNEDDYHNDVNINRSAEFNEYNGNRNLDRNNGQWDGSRPENGQNARDQAGQGNAGDRAGQGNARDQAGDRSGQENARDQAAQGNARSQQQAASMKSGGQTGQKGQGNKKSSGSRKSRRGNGSRDKDRGR